MSELAVKSRLPGADALALVGLAVGYALWGKHWLGLLILPLALLLPFVLRELDLVPDDERVREAWRRAGFWAFAMMVAQGFLFFGLEIFASPEDGILAAVLPHFEYVEVIRGPAIVFAAVYLMAMAGEGEGARRVLLILALLTAVGWISDRLNVGFRAGWEWAFAGAWWVRTVLPIALAGLGWLAVRRPRPAGVLLLGCAAISAVVSLWWIAPMVMPTPEVQGLTPPLRVDGRFIVAGHLSIDLALAIIAFLLLRSPRGDEA